LNLKLKKESTRERQRRFRARRKAAGRTEIRVTVDNDLAKLIQVIAGGKGTTVEALASDALKTALNDKVQALQALRDLIGNEWPRIALYLPYSRRLTAPGIRFQIKSGMILTSEEWSEMEPKTVRALTVANRIFGAKDPIGFLSNIFR
jgi:hypothetical protein